VIPNDEQTMSTYHAVSVCQSHTLLMFPYVIAISSYFQNTRLPTILFTGQYWWQWGKKTHLIKTVCHLFLQPLPSPLTPFKFYTWSQLQINAAPVFHL